MEKLAFLQNLREGKIKMTKSQRLICNYLLEHYQEIAMMSAVEFGEKVNVSDATISRFVRLIGFENFHEFKTYLREHIQTFDTPYKRYEMLKESGVVKEAVDREYLLKMGHQDLINIEKLMATMDMQVLESAVDCIFKARRVYILGVGSSSSLIDFLRLHFRRMGFKVIAVSEGGTYDPERMLDMNKGDVLLAVLFPRYSRVTYEAIGYAHNKQAAVVSITDGNFEPIAQYSDVVIPVSIDSITFFNSVAVQLVLGSWLVMLLFDKDSSNIKECVRENTNNSRMLNHVI